MNTRLPLQPPGGYLRRLTELGATMQFRRGEVVNVLVSHDGWCSLLAGGRCCTCDPDIRVLRHTRAS